MKNTGGFGPFCSADRGGGFSSIDTSGFDEVILRMEALRGMFQKQRENLQAKAEDLLSDGWEGSGAQAFEKSFKNISRYFDDDLESLETVVENLRKIQLAYMELDAEIAAKVEKSLTDGAGGGGGGGR